MMTTKRNLRRAMALGVLLMMLGVWGCSAGVSTGRRYPPPARHPGPPAHAPAHGYRAKYRYTYYPCAYVYFDIDRRVYFYMEGEVWKMSAALPPSVDISVEAAVTIDLDDDKPYLHFDEHKAKYPPGQVKKEGNEGKGAGHGKGKDK